MCRVCLVGDFNSIRRVEERSGRNESPNLNEIGIFDKFIRGSQLIELPLVGRKFTCYRPDGSCKSRLDRVLVNNKWI